jgi:release factor glutamine methyltransferase
MEKKPVSVKMIVDEFRDKLSSQYEPAELMQFVYLLFEEAMGWTKTKVHMEPGFVLEGEKTAYFRDAMEQLKRNRPIQYIIGATDFVNTRIRVREGVLIPRPETEELVAMILKDFAHSQYERLSVLDIGTGSGCIALALKKEMPCFEVHALDLSPVSLQVTNENAALNHCEINVIASDILDRSSWPDFPGYSIIVSNPPYIPESDRLSMQPNVLDYEPREALFVPDKDPLVFYTAIAEFAFLHLVRPGFLYLEINERFGRELKNMLISMGYDRPEILKDIHGKDRFIRAETKTTMKDTSYWNVEH